VSARAQGFTQVYWFRGGFPEWVAKGYPVETVATNVVLTR
jgi:rhodanese-related sulfurtransferase